MLNEWLSLGPALVAGLALGIFYFGSLWLTVQRLPDARQPALLALGSLTARLGLTLLVVYLVTGGQWARIGVCLLGFFVTRTILVQRWQPRVSPAAKEGSSRGTWS
jgi:F1F0 ATPase subunit 2